MRASHLSPGHVIRLGAGQGAIWEERSWAREVHPARQASARTLDVRRTWREVLGAYADRASLEAWAGGRLDGDLARLAEEAWENRHRAMVVQVLIHEASDACEITDVFVIVNLHDLIEAQSMPATGLQGEWDCGPSGELAPGMLDQIVLAAGELWDSTSGRDHYNTLSRTRRNALDHAAALYRAATRETIDGGAPGAADAEAAG